MSAAPAREPLTAVTWAGGVEDGRLIIIDRRFLPGRIEQHELTSLDAVIEAIRSGAISGVGAVALSGAYTLALHAFKSALAGSDVEEALTEAGTALAIVSPDSLPTRRALTRMRECFDRHVGKLTNLEIAARLLMEAKRIHLEAVELSERIAKLGAPILPESGNVVMIGATGALAYGGHGTALAAVLRALEEGKDITVCVIAGSDGGTTNVECAAKGIRVEEWTLAHAANCMRRGEVACVLAGAERITAGGDALGVKGTYALLHLAYTHGVPTAVAAPYTVFDFSVENGDDVPTAVDVTPAAIISVVITGRGVIRRPTKGAVEGMMRDREDPGIA